MSVFEATILLVVDVGVIENAADAAMRGAGGLTPSILIGVGMSGLLGGIVLTALAGFFQRRTPQ